MSRIKIAHGPLPDNPYARAGDICAELPSRGATVRPISPCRGCHLPACGNRRATTTHTPARERHELDDAVEKALCDLYACAGGSWQVP